MNRWNNGFSNINVKLLNCETDLAEKAYQFGKLGEFYDKKTSKKQLISEIIKGKTFPKFVFEGINLAFRIEGISRICLAQLTRERGFFCSASGDVRPLTMNHNIPLSIMKNKKWVDQLNKIQDLIEKLYIDLLKHDIPYMDARYIGLHSQTISLSYCTSVFNFMKSCNSRTENNFADEINYVYRLCLWELKQFLKKHIKDKYNKQLWSWLLSFADKKGPYLRDHTYNNDFNRFETPKNYKSAPAHNDWRRSGWKLELENIKLYKPYLLFNGESEMIARWSNNKDLKTTFDKNGVWAGRNMVEKANYYKKWSKKLCNLKK